jgi:hypothetical protein
MRVSIRKTVVATVAALGMATAVASMPTPAEAQFHGGGGFHGGGLHGGGFGGGFHGGGWGGGWRGGGWHKGGWGRRLGLAARWLGRRLGWRLLELWLGLGLGFGSRLGDCGGEPCPSGSRSLHSRPMAATRVAGSGGASGRQAGTIWAGGS